VGPPRKSTESRVSLHSVDFSGVLEGLAAFLKLVLFNVCSVFDHKTTTQILCGHSNQKRP